MKIIGFTAGAFDLLHAGHCHFLDVCRDHCDELHVGLHIDPSIEREEKSKPVQTAYERYVQLMCHWAVNSVMPYETELDLCNMLAINKFDKRFLGNEYENYPQYVTGYKICQDLETELIFITRMHTYSSSELRKRINGNS